MDIEVLKNDLIDDEGICYEIYLDHKGYSTAGIGHLLTTMDPEYSFPVGTEVSPERVNEWFEEDINNVILDCNLLFCDFYSLPEEVKLVIANMMFNLGRTRLAKFKKFIAAIDNTAWEAAADEMIDSLWYTQVPNRANRLCNRMRNIRHDD